MIFGVLNPEKIWHQQLVHLPTSPYTIATLPWEIQKKVIFQEYYSCILDYLRNLRRKQTVTPLPTTPEKYHHTTL